MRTKRKTKFGAHLVDTVNQCNALTSKTLTVLLQRRNLSLCVMLFLPV